MHYWQSWGSSLVFSTAFDFFFLFFFLFPYSLATVLTNRELNVFAEQPGIFFAYVVIYVAGLSSSTMTHWGWIKLFYFGFTWKCRSRNQCYSLTRQAAFPLLALEPSIAATNCSQLHWKISPSPSWRTCPFLSDPDDQLSPTDHQPGALKDTGHPVSIWLYQM